MTSAKRGVPATASLVRSIGHSPQSPTHFHMDGRGMRGALSERHGQELQRGGRGAHGVGRLRIEQLHCACSAHSTIE